MEIEAEDINSPVDPRFNRHFRRRSAASLRGNSARFHCRRLYRKSVCEAASSPTGAPSPVFPRPAASFPARCASRSSGARLSMCPAPAALSATHGSPTVPHASGDRCPPTPAPLSSSLPSQSLDRAVVDGLRLQVERSLCRAREAEQNEYNLRMALQEAEDNRAAVLRTLEEYRHLKSPEREKTLKERVCQLEAENSLMRNEVQEKKSYISQEKEAEKLSQQLLDVSCTLEEFQRKHLALLQRAKGAEYLAADAEISDLATPSVHPMFAETPGAQPMFSTTPEAPCKSTASGACDEERSRQTGDICKLSLLSPACGMWCPPAAGDDVHGEKNTLLEPLIGKCLLDEDAPAPLHSCPSINELNSCNVSDASASDARLRGKESLCAAEVSSPKLTEYIRLLQEDNTALKRSLLEASAAIDQSNSLLRKKEGELQQLLRRKNEDADHLQEQEERIQQLMLKEKKSQQLLQQKTQETNHLREALAREELAKASAEQVSSKLNARVTALLLQTHQAESRLEKMEEAYQSTIRNLEGRLQTCSSRVCIDAETQTALLSSAPSPFKEFLELNSESVSCLTLSMKKRLVDAEQEKSDRLLEHQRLLDEKEFQLAQISARFASATEEHAAEKNKLQAKIVRVEGELDLEKTRLQTMARKLQQTRGRLYEATAAHEALAVEKQQETCAQQRQISTLELRLQAEKEKLKEALCSLDVFQTHLRRFMQTRRMSATSTQASQTEDGHSVIVEVPAEFQEQLDQAFDTQSVNMPLPPACHAKQNPDEPAEFFQAGEKGNSCFQPGGLQCANHACMEFAAEASERICMLTAALLYKKHALSVAEEKLSSLVQEFKTNCSLTRQLLEGRHTQEEVCRGLLRAEIEWREKCTLLEKENDLLRNENKEAIEKTDLLHTSESKLQQDVQLLREELRLCRRQLEDLHKEHTTCAARERSEHEQLLQTLRNYLTKKQTGRCSPLHLPVEHDGKSTHVPCAPSEPLRCPEASPPEMTTEVNKRGILTVKEHQGALKRPADAMGTDLIGAVHHLTAVATSLLARIAKRQSNGAPASCPTSVSSAPAHNCSASVHVHGGCCAGEDTPANHDFGQWQDEGCGRRAVSRFNKMRLCSSCPEICGLSHNALTGRTGPFEKNTGAELRGQLLWQEGFPVHMRGRYAAKSAAQKRSGMKGKDINVLLHPESLSNRCRQRDASPVGALKRGESEGSFECTQLDYVPLGESATHRSTIHARTVEFLDQLCDLFLCACHRLADAEYAAATNEVVAALTYKQWQLQKARENEILGDRALLRHKLQVLSHQLSASQAADYRLTSGLCRIYRDRCEEMEKQQLTVIQQLRGYEEERKRLLSNLKDTGQRAQDLEKRLLWSEAEKAEVKLVAESTAEERVMQRLLTFKEDVLEKIREEATQSTLASAEPVWKAERAGHEGTYVTLHRVRQLLTQERRERAAVHFALKEVQHENGVLLRLLDQKEKQLILMQDLKLPGAANAAVTVDKNKHAGGFPEDTQLQHGTRDVSLGRTTRPPAEAADTSPRPTDISANSSGANVQAVLPEGDEIDASHAELLWTIAHMKRLLHQQQLEMHKQADKLSCRELEAANLRSRNESLSNDLNRYTSQLNEAHAALEDAARVRARMQELECWASRLKQAHQAELNSQRSAQEFLLQQKSVEWEAKTAQQLTALHAENANLRSVTKELCADAAGLRQQLSRYKEAMQRHNVLEELSQASIKAVQDFQLKCSGQTLRSTTLQQAAGMGEKAAAPSQSLSQHRRRGSVSPGLALSVRRASASRQGGRVNNRPRQRLMHGLLLTVVKCLLQAFAQLCIELSECERQLLTDLCFNAFAKSKRSNSRGSVALMPSVLRVAGSQPELSVMRGQRIVIRWLSSLNPVQTSRREFEPENITAPGVFFPANADTAKYLFDPLGSRESDGREEMARGADAMMAAALGCGPPFQYMGQHERQPQQTRLLHRVREEARELLSALRENCHTVSIATSAQHLIVHRLKGIEKKLTSMRRAIGEKRKLQHKRCPLSKASSGSPGSRCLVSQPRSRGDRGRCSHKRSSSRSCGRSPTFSIRSSSGGSSNSGKSPASEHLSFEAEKDPARKGAVHKDGFALSSGAWFRSLSEVEHLLQLVLFSAQECSSTMEKTDVVSQLLHSNLEVLLRLRSHPTGVAAWKGTDLEENNKQGVRLFSSKAHYPPTRLCPMLSRTTYIKSTKTSHKNSTVRGRSLSLPLNRGERFVKSQDLISEWRYVSTPVTRRRSHRSRSSLAEYIPCRRQEPRRLDRDNLSSARKSPFDTSTRTSSRRTSNESRAGKRASARERDHDFASSHPWCSLARAIARKLCMCSCTGRSPVETQHREVSTCNNTASVGQIPTTHCNHTSCATSAPVTPLTSSCQQNDSATRESKSRSTSSCPAACSPLLKAGCERERVATCHECQPQQEMYRHPLWRSACNDEQLEARQEPVNTGSQSGSSPSGSPERHAFCVEQSAGGYSAGDTATPQLHPPVCAAKDHFIGAPHLNASDGNYAGGAESLPAHFSQAGQNAQENVDTVRERKSVHTCRDCASATHCFPFCNATCQDSPYQEESSSAACAAEWPKESRDELLAGHSTLPSLTSPMRAVSKQRTTVDCKLQGTAAVARKADCGPSKISRRAAAPSTTRADAARAATTEKTNSSACKTTANKSEPLSSADRDARPLSPAERRVVILSPSRRQRTARQSVPSCLTKESGLSVQRHGETCRSPIASNALTQEQASVNGSRFRRNKHQPEIHELKHGKPRQVKQYSCRMVSRMTTLRVDRRDWLPPLSAYQGSLQQTSDVTKSGKDRSPSAEKLSSLAAGVADPVWKAEARENSIPEACERL